MKIDAGDFIWTGEFSEEEWGIFYQLMIDNGYTKTDQTPIESDGEVWGVFGVHINNKDTYAYKGDDEELVNDISVKFHRYLDNNKPEQTVSPSISPKPIVAIHKEDNVSEHVYNVRVYYARDLKHLLEQMDNDQESLADYGLFNLGEELEMTLREKSGE